MKNKKATEGKRKLDSSAGQFTPGPWTLKPTAVYDAVYGKDGELVSFVGIQEIESAKANARLIAAAPELLEALQLAKSIIQLGYKATPSELGVMIDAIAKAEGSSLRSEGGK